MIMPTVIYRLLKPNNYYRRKYSTLLLPYVHREAVFQIGLQLATALNAFEQFFTVNVNYIKASANS